MEDAQQYLSFDDLIDLLEVEEQDVILPGWGARPIRVRPLTIEETTAIAKAAQGSEDRMAQLMVQHCLIVPALSETQVRLVWTKQAGKFKPLITLLNRINGFGTPDEQAAQADAREAEFRAQ